MHYFKYDKIRPTPYCLTGPDLMSYVWGTGRKARRSSSSAKII